MSFRDYLVAVSNYHRKFPKMRMGQCYWNCLPVDQINKMRAAYNAQLNGDIPFDPFYTDSNLPEFLCYVERNW